MSTCAVRQRVERTRETPRGGRSAGRQASSSPPHESQRAVSGRDVAHRAAARWHFGVRAGARSSTSRPSALITRRPRPPVHRDRAGVSVVRGIQQDQVEFSVPRRAPQHARNVTILDSIALLYTRRARGSPRSARLRAGRASMNVTCARASTERFDADGAGTRKPVEHPCALDPRRDDVEQRFTQLVGGRAASPSQSAPQAATLERSGDHAHAEP